MEPSPRISDDATEDTEEAIVSGSSALRTEVLRGVSLALPGVGLAPMKKKAGLWVIA